MAKIAIKLRDTVIEVDRIFGVETIKTPEGNRVRVNTGMDRGFGDDGSILTGTMDPIEAESFTAELRNKM